MILDIEQITPLVRQILSIEDITAGDPQKTFVVCYRGQLNRDPQEAYQVLDNQLKTFTLTPLFRLEGEKHVVIIQAGRVQDTRSNPKINFILFGVTLLSVIFTGAVSSYQPPREPVGVKILVGGLIAGLPFALSLMGILLAHELGHYFIGRARGAPVTLPYFIPLPLSPFGTMGAVIQMKAPPRNRRALLDIGIAGPLAGMAIAIPVLIYGLSLSKVEIIKPLTNGTFQMEGNSLLYLFLKWVMFGQVLPHPVSFQNLPPALYWLIYFFTGKPFPWGALDVMIHPVAFAGWAGLFVTALNLLPVGQLDGGHILSALMGKKARKLFPFIVAATVILGFAWSGWWLWTVLLLFVGRAYDEPLDQITTLDTGRKFLAILGLVLFILVFTPVPLIIITGTP